MCSSQLSARAARMPVMTDSHSQPEVTDPIRWSPLERLAFRFAFVYFAMFGCASLLDVGTGPRAFAARLFDPPVRWVARIAFGLTDPSSVGGARWAAAQQITAFGVAAILAVIWSAVSSRAEYRRLRGWFFIVLRYYVAVIMMIYGGFKIINSQFPPLSLEQLSEPLGSMAPMGLLWAFMGYSSVYAAFTGLGEATGAFLLFFRRTTTAGALILIAVLSNVALLNYVFDVPVKQLSFNLLLASIVLAAADARRLIDVWLLNRAAVPVDVSFDFRRRWLYGVRRVLKPIVVIGATCGPIVASALVHRRIVERPPLFGLYDVDAFVRNGVNQPAIARDWTRWRQVALSRPGVMSVKFMNDSVRMYSVTVDTVARRVSTRSRNGAVGSPIAIAYEPRADGGLRLFGAANGDSLDVTLVRVDHERVFRLLHRR